MKPPGLEGLRTQLAALESTLESFHAPDVDEHPGLQLMARALEERTEHVRSTIADIERSSVSVRLEGRAVADGSAPVGLAGAVLAALADAVADAAAAVDGERGAGAAELHLLEVTPDGEGLALELGRPPGPLDAQLVDPSGGLVVDLALEAVARALSDDDRDAGDEAATAASAAVGRLAEALRDADVAGTVTFAPATRGQREVALTGEVLARLVADGG